MPDATPPSRPAARYRLAWRVLGRFNRIIGLVFITMISLLMIRQGVAWVQGRTSQPAAAASLDSPVLLIARPQCDERTPGILLQWSPVSKATQYQIYRDGALVYTTQTAGTRFWNVTGLSSGQKYLYQVRASDGSDVSSLSNGVTAIAPSCGGAGAAAFQAGDGVQVTDTLRLRTCASMSNDACPSQVSMQPGTGMVVTAGPVAADGFIWWQLTGEINGRQFTGWAIQDYLRK